MFSLESKDNQMDTCTEIQGDYIINTHCTLDLLKYKYYGKDKNCAKAVKEHSFKKGYCAIFEDGGLETYVMIQVD